MQNRARLVLNQRRLVWVTEYVTKQTHRLHDGHDAQVSLSSITAAENNGKA